MQGLCLVGCHTAQHQRSVVPLEWMDLDVDPSASSLLRGGGTDNGAQHLSTRHAQKEQCGGGLFRAYL